MSEALSRIVYHDGPEIKVIADCLKAGQDGSTHIIEAMEELTKVCEKGITMNGDQVVKLGKQMLAMSKNMTELYNKIRTLELERKQ